MHTLFEKIFLLNLSSYSESHRSVASLSSLKQRSPQGRIRSALFSCQGAFERTLSLIRTGKRQSFTLFLKVLSIIPTGRGNLATLNRKIPLTNSHWEMPNYKGVKKVLSLIPTERGDLLSPSTFNCWIFSAFRHFSFKKGIKKDAYLLISVKRVVKFKKW